MIVIYTQDEAYIYKDAKDAKNKLIDLYGGKLGTEAYKALETARQGYAFRKYGGPLVQVVSEEKSEWIREKENRIGNLLNRQENQ